MALSINDIKSKVANIPKKQVKNAYLEIEITNDCNLNCAYCFERKNKNRFKRDIEYENLVIYRLKELFLNWQDYNYNGLLISFWGGEPTLNVDFIKKIFDVTKTLDFVKYNIFSNGVKTDKIKELFELFGKKMHFQISYDGLYHDKYRNNSSKPILDTVEFLHSVNAEFDLKATVHKNEIKNLSKIWDSYKELQKKFEYIKFSPTIDQDYILSSDVSDFEEQIKIIIKKELSFFIKNKRFLMTWFDTGKKICKLEDSCFINSDKKFYICHGAPYSTTQLKLQTKSIVDNKIEFFSDKYENSLPSICRKCVAQICIGCSVNITDSLDSWVSSRINNNCILFKIFGVYAKILKFKILKMEKNNG